MNKLLYFCVNDGSDMRTLKEVRSLAKEYDVYYLGVGRGENAFCQEYCKKFELVCGEIKNPFTILKLLKNLVQWRIKYNFSSIHVQEEQLLIISYPFLFGAHVILDIFDSIFLKKDVRPESLLWLKRLIYNLPRKIIVTDENRKGLLPKSVQSKAFVIPNVPIFNSSIYGIQKLSSDKVRLGLFGSLAQKRGVEFAKKLAEFNPSKYQVVAAGWLADDYSKKFVKSHDVNYLGVMQQEESLRYIAENIDFIVSIYPLDNMNNINASPNKLYDSVHTKTPIIINRGVNVSAFIERLNVGIVIDDLDTVYEIDRKLTAKNFNGSFAYDLAKSNSWDEFESLLISLHKS
ncbi:hypothetical protein WM008_21555 [Vibrio vulnificus]|uniref:hypothetical protein n=1 Tax=Vibrio vulnificus TaxID=672 RepID=UPI001EEB7820|nr:hypothetical protein [Vibrio vulnificus]MCG6270846.1 hypothetical protein [Vibrio vulnificus]MCU8185775.1 hypothetical protein [Vibrio vulnificus]